ncbi:unnamed protein product, partial [Prunus brigantina]
SYILSLKSTSQYSFSQVFPPLVCDALFTFWHYRGYTWVISESSSSGALTTELLLDRSDPVVTSELR